MSDLFLDSSAVGYRRRGRILAFAAVVGVLGLLIQLANLQLFEGHRLSEVSTQNFERTVMLPAERGTIYDRRGRVLAFHRPSFDLYVTPAQVKDVDALIEGLRRVTDLDELEYVRLTERVIQPRGMWRHRAVRVARDIDRRRVALVEGLRARLDGLSVRVRYQREFPFGTLGAHLLGYLGKPTAAELKADAEGRYQADSMIGRFGLERRYESTLSGSDGYERYAVNARGARQRGGWADRAMEPIITREPPVAGHDLHLSVDLDVQRILVRALRDYQAGAAVVLDPRDGSVRGIVSKPSFDPNAWSGRLTAEKKRAVDENPFLPMLDKSVHAFFPGSVYKVVTALAGLEEGILDPDLRVDSPGSYTFGNRVFHCHKRSGHGLIDLDDAMAASADVYFYRLGEQLGIETLARYGRALGFGTRPGLGINGESPGMVPTRAHHHEKTKGGFQQGFALSTAVGQGDVRASPLQVALAYGAFANGGTLYAPRIVETVRDRAGNVVNAVGPRTVATVPGAERHVPIINRSLERAVNDQKRGTGTLAAVADLNVAGKTGTAQVREIIRGRGRQAVKRFRDRDHAWFAAFAPYHEPRIVVVIFLEHGGSGGKNAAPLAKEIIEAYHRRVEPILGDRSAEGPTSAPVESP